MRAAAGLLIALATTVAPVGAQPTITAASAPPGVETLAVEWIRVAAPGLGGVILAAVARPAGAGPFPSVVLLHGTHGFAREYVRLAQDLAAGGVLAVAACWFRGGAGVGARFVTPVPCGGDAPSMPVPTSAEAMRTVETLLRAARALPGARADRIALFGHSRGGGAALSYVLRGGAVQAAVISSGGYPGDFGEQAAKAGATTTATATTPSSRMQASTATRCSAWSSSCYATSARRRIPARISPSLSAA